MAHTDHTPGQGRWWSRTGLDADKLNGGNAHVSRQELNRSFHVNGKITPLFRQFFLNGKLGFQVENLCRFLGTAVRRLRLMIFFTAAFRDIAVFSCAAFQGDRQGVFSATLGGNKQREGCFAHAIAINLLPTHANGGDKKRGYPKPGD